MANTNDIFAPKRRRGVGQASYEDMEDEKTRKSMLANSYFFFQEYVLSYIGT